MKKQRILQVFLLVAILSGIIGFSVHYDKKSVGNIEEDEVIVAVIDSGLEVGSIPEERLYDFKYDCIRDVTEVTDEYGHGTSVSSLIVNNTNDRVKIMPICVTDEKGNSTVDLVYKGIECAVNNGADIINISMNTPFYSDDNKLEELIDRLTLQGIPVVVSAGNSAEDVKYITPANIESAIVVGAVDDAEDLYYFSNYGDTVDYYAYGKYDGQLGTSFSSAYVTSILAEEMQISGCNFKDALEKSLIVDKDNKHIFSKKMNIGKKVKEDGTLYIGGVEKTSHNVGVGILDIDWRNLDVKELDAYIGETDYKYVGLFLSKLSEADREELIEKSKILSTDVYVGIMEYSEEEDAFLEADNENIPYVDYALQCYEKEKDVMSVSNWYAKNDATFYISSPDRRKIGKYTIYGFKEKYIVVDPQQWYGSVVDTFTYSVSTYKDEGLSYSGDFTIPRITSVNKYFAEARATLVEYYDANGNFLYDVFNNSHVSAGNDDGAYHYHVSIGFSGYSNTRQGYHNYDGAVVGYNASSGVGTSTSEATYTAVGYGSWKQMNLLNFNHIARGSIKVKYQASLKWGADATNFTRNDINSFGAEKIYDDIYYLTSQTSLVDGSSTFSLSGNPYYAMGLQWYSYSSGKRVAYSSVPEYVMLLAPNTYTVNYDGNGASGGSTGSSSHTYDVDAALSENGFWRDNYNFAGWNTKADGSGTWYENGATVRNLTATNGGSVTLYAQWAPNPYTVHFDGNGATGGSMTDMVCAFNTDYTINGNGFLKDGYDFNGWNTAADGSGTAYSNLQTINNLTTIPSDVVTLYAQWTPKKYIVKFDGNGATSGSIDSIELTYDEPKNLPLNTFERDMGTYYSTFLGWNTDANAKTPLYSDGQEVVNIQNDASSVTLFAIWDDDNYYQIVYDGNGATGGSMEALKCNFDRNYNLNANAFTRIGYKFTGWNTNANGSGTSYEDKATINNLSTTKGTKVILYAQWEALEVSYKIKHHLENINGGYSVESTDSKIGYTGTTLTASSFKNTYTGFTYDHAEVDENTVTTTTIKGDESLVINLYYSRNSYTVTLKKDVGISKVEGAGTYKYDEEVIINPTVRNGYKWNNWVGTYTTDIKIYKFNMPAENVTMTATTAPIVFKVTLDNQGATTAGTTIYYQKFEVDIFSNSSCTITLSKIVTPTKTGYEFQGYYTEVNGGGTKYIEADGDIIASNSQFVEDTTLYAYWTPLKYNIRFEGNGATSGSMSDLKCTYDTTSYLPENGFVKTHYTFTGWNTKSDGSGTHYDDKASIFNITTTPNDVITLYAQWSANKYYIHFDANGGEGYMDDIELTYDTPQKLPSNVFTRNNEYGDSTFLGWNIIPDTREVLYVDGAEVINAAEVDWATVTLYAIWDDCPWIEASDLYYSLMDAKNGAITYDELMRHAAAFDREDGENIPVGIDEEKGISFTIIDYQPNDFTTFISDGSITETYQIIDSSGNSYKQTIMVYIVDTEPKEIGPIGTTRFINEKYYNESYENGGLEDNSIWKTDPEYIAVIRQAFENSNNNTPIMSYHFEYEEILEMKAYIHENGIGNSLYENALEEFYVRFLEPNTIS